MDERTINDHGIKYELIPEGDLITVSLSKGLIKEANQQILDLTLQPDENLLPGSIRDTTDKFQWVYGRPKNYKPSEQLNSLSREERLRAALNFKILAKFINQRITVLVHPDNLLWDENLIPHVIHRGLSGSVPPLELTETEVLRGFQAWAISLVEQKYQFDDLVAGTLENIHATPFNQMVRDTHTVDELADVIRQNYLTELDRQEKTTTTVPRKKQRFYQNGFIISTVLAVVLAVLCGYFAFVKLPFEQKMQNSQTSFLSDNYDKVINQLEDVTPKSLPKTEKYILATSYVNVEKLSATQKKNVLKNISLSSDDNYLLYWIYDGRGDFDKSLDLAKYVNDDQLIFYSYTKLYDAANQNTKLSGSKKQALLKKYQKQINKYSKKLGGVKNAAN